MDTVRSDRSDLERQTFEQGLLEHQASLRAYARSLTKSPSAADDLVQETYCKALSHRHLFTPGTNLKAWLFTIARNTFFTAFKRAKRESGVDVEELLKTVLQDREQEDAEAVYDLKRLLLYLACLPAHQRHAVVAVGYIGMSYEEAAERFGCKIGTIKSRVSRGRDLLIELIRTKTVKHIDLAPLRTATRGVPKNHHFYPIAKAYEELYVASEDVGGLDELSVSGDEKLWQRFVASGVLDDEEDFATLMRGEEL